MFTSSIALCCRCSDGRAIDEQIFKILKICIHTKVKGVPTIRKFGLLINTIASQQIQILEEEDDRQTHHIIKYTS